MADVSLVVLATLISLNVDFRALLLSHDFCGYLSARDNGLPDGRSAITSPDEKNAIENDLCSRLAFVSIDIDLLTLFHEVLTASIINDRKHDPALSAPNGPNNGVTTNLESLLYGLPALCPAKIAV